MDKVITFLQKIGNAFCCCFRDRTNPEEMLPLKPSQNRINNNNPLTSTLLTQTKPEQPFFDQSIEDIINHLSSGDDDDPIDPAQEEKYKEILNQIND